MKSADIAVHTEAQLCSKNGDLEEDTLGKSVTKNIQSATSEVSNGVDGKATGKGMRVNGRRRRKASQLVEAIVQTDKTAQVPSTSIGEGDDAVVSEPTTWKARRKPRANDEVEHTSVDAPLDEDAASKPGNTARPSRSGRTKRKMKNEAVVLDDSSEPLTKPNSSECSNRATRRDVVPVTTAPDRETRPVNPVRRMQRRKAKDMMEINVSSSDTAVALPKSPNQKRRPGNPTAATSCARTRSGPRFELDSAAAIDERLPDRHPSAARRSAKSIGQTVSEHRHPKHAEAGRDMPLTEIDANLARRSTSPQKPVIPLTRTARTHPVAPTPNRRSRRCVSPRMSSMQTALSRQGRSKSRYQGHHPSLQDRDEQQIQQIGFANVSAASDAVVNGADMQAGAQNESAMTRTADPAVWSSRTSQSLKCGTGAEEAGATVNRRAKSSHLAPSTVAHPPGTAAQAHRTSKDHRSGKGGQAASPLPHDDEEIMDWLVEPAQWVCQPKVQRSNAGRSTSISHKSSKSRTQILDIDLDDLISNIASFAKCEALGQQGKIISNSVPKSKSKSKRER